MNTYTERRGLNSVEVIIYKQQVTPKARLNNKVVGLSKLVQEVMNRSFWTVSVLMYCHVMFCRPIILYLLNCIIETILMTESRLVVNRNWRFSVSWLPGWLPRRLYPECLSVWNMMSKQRMEEWTMWTSSSHFSN